MSSFHDSVHEFDHKMKINEIHKKTDFDDGKMKMEGLLALMVADL